MTDFVFGEPCQPCFATGDRVAVRRAYPVGHCRTPYYLRGTIGIVERCCGAFANPEELAYGRAGLPARPLYRVRVALADLWADYAGSDQDTLEVEVFEDWLLPTGKEPSNA